jgi:hypothetical protein
MSDTVTVPPTTAHTWVAFGPAGAIGSIHRTGEGYGFRLIGEELRPTVYPTLAVAKSALCGAMPTGSERPEFREH